MESNGVFISEENSKLGRILNVSLPPILTCGSQRPCFAKCYAMKSWNRTFKDIRIGWGRNWYLYQDAPRSFFTGVYAAVRDRGAKWFRWHVGGDIVDAQYYSGMRWVAAACPKTQFLCFTKRHDLLRGFRGTLPENLRMVASMWPGWGNPPKRFPKAWCEDPKNPDPRIPKSARKCPGHCDKCHLCWKLGPTQDVVFRIH